MTDKTYQKKKRAYLWGQGAEWLAICFLTLKGYRIVARRFKCKSGEIDLIAQKRNLICFIEVKARKTTHDALYALSHKQKRRISKAAEWYIAKNGHHDNIYRFDVMAVEPWRLPTHVTDAWQMEIVI
ncbi:MAG: hypothetical protein COA93_00190 [Alphaproteobacteria bacterium]|nr:MAG: hypothetical protein COA93_00190 [Alphaproteobacteria bacterium]